MRIALMVLIGLPASGKTTLAKNLLKTNSEKFSFIHVCYDDLISTFDSNWKESRKTVTDKIHDLITSAKNNDPEKCPPDFQNQLKHVDLKNKSLVIIIDDNMYYKSMRFSLYQIAQEEEISFCQVYVKCTVEDALRNNKNRKLKVPSNIIIEMSNKIEVPNVENKWERHSLVLSKDNVNYQDFVCKVLDECLDDPEKKLNLDERNVEREMAAAVTLTNIIHQVDVALRHIIGNKIKVFINNTGDKKLVKDYSLKVNDKKNDYLNCLKKGEMSLPDEVLKEIGEVDVQKKIKLESYLEGIFL